MASKKHWLVAISPKGPSVDHCWSCHYMFKSSGVSICAKSIQRSLVDVWCLGDYNLFDSSHGIVVNKLWIPSETLHVADWNVLILHIQVWICLLLVSNGPCSWLVRENYALFLDQWDWIGGNRLTSHSF
jgi:hypothetical protein